VEFGLFTEFQCPAGRTESDAFDESIAQSIEARDEAEASTMHFYRSIGRALEKTDATAWTNDAREARAQRLTTLTYDDVLRDHAIFGSPESVTDRLLALREDVGFTSLSAWMNPGGHLGNDRVVHSMRLFAERVMPRL